MFGEITALIFNSNLGRLVLGIDGLQTKSSVYVPNAFIELSAYKKRLNITQEKKQKIFWNKFNFVLIKTFIISCISTNSD